MLPWQPYSLVVVVVVAAVAVAAAAAVVVHRKGGLQKFSRFSVTKFHVKYLIIEREEFLKLCTPRMNLGSAQFVPSRWMGVAYEPMANTWGEFRGNSCPDTALPEVTIEVDTKPDNQSEDSASHGAVEPCNKYEEDTDKVAADKIRASTQVMRRLAQNREAARKSRLRKKAYVQQLEDSKLKLIQLEQELDRARQQGMHVNQLSYSGTINPGISSFETKYGHWVEEQNRQISALRNALHTSVGDVELKICVDNGMKHYSDLFNMKAAAARTNVFYLMSGMWRTPVERFFFWIGGFQPSELLKVMIPYLEPLTEQQHLEVDNLRGLCRQAEDALSQGMEKLRGILAEDVACPSLGEGNYLPKIGATMEKLGALERFVSQADHLRQETLQQLLRLLTTQQAAQGLLALGEYLQRLRAMSSLWSSHPDRSRPK